MMGMETSPVVRRENDMEYRYGMRLRGFSLGCQPMRGFLRREDDKHGKYYDIIVYSRELTAQELTDYELDDLRCIHRTYRKLKLHKEI